MRSVTLVELGQKNKSLVGATKEIASMRLGCGAEPHTLVRVNGSGHDMAIEHNHYVGVGEFTHNNTKSVSKNTPRS